MKETEKFNLEQYVYEKIWKNKNQEYIFQLDKMLDLIDNIEENFLKLQIRNQMIKYDRTLTKIAEETFEKIKNENL